MTEQEAIEKVAQKGQLDFGYVDWETELPKTKQRWCDLGKFAVSILKPLYIEQGRQEMVERVKGIKRVRTISYGTYSDKELKQYLDKQIQAVLKEVEG